MPLSRHSAHDERVKTGLVRGELVRYLRLCSTESMFEKAWQRFRGHLEQRGYPSGWLKRARGDLEWKNRSEIMKRLDERTPVTPEVLSAGMCRQVP